MKAIPERHILCLTILAALASPVVSANPLNQISVQSPAFVAAAGGNGDSGPAVISPDGRYVLFSSAANNLALTTNGNPIPVPVPAHSNVYLRDRASGTTTLLSVNLAGTGGGDGDSFADGISSNGLYALFESNAANLTGGIDSNVTQVFVRDLVHGTNLLVSGSTNGGLGNDSSSGATMTPDGRYVAFVSAASNLVAGDTNGIPDIFVRDLTFGHHHAGQSRGTIHRDNCGELFRRAVYYAGWPVCGIFQFGHKSGGGGYQQRRHLCSRPCARNHNLGQRRCPGPIAGCLWYLEWRLLQP